jgi:hypothetical protein
VDRFGHLRVWDGVDFEVLRTMQTQSQAAQPVLHLLAYQLPISRETRLVTG